MAVTNLAHDAASVALVHAALKTKVVFIVLLFLLSLASFVTQTEFTLQAYQLGFSEPLILLLVTHGMWWLLWPLQAVAVLLWRTAAKVRLETATYQHLDLSSQLLEGQQTRKRVSKYAYFKKSIVKQIHNVYHTAVLIYEANVNGDRSKTGLNQLIDLNPHILGTDLISDCVVSLTKTPAFRYVFVRATLITIVLTVAGSTWYAAMAMTYAADVTAIYNCLAFTAYAFAIPLLNEKFSWLKASSVVIAVSGVFVVAYSGTSDAPASDAPDPYPYRFWGNLLIFVGAILYGYYEVLYKKYLCISEHLTKIITPRRQLTFANFVMGLLGLVTLVLLLTTAILSHVLHIHRFNLFNYGENTSIIWAFVCGSIVSNLLFSALFLSLMALTSPVLSSVSALLTIFLIGVVEWALFDNTLSLRQLSGDFLVVVGFVILTAASWKEISEGNDDDDVETVSTFSLAVSNYD